MARLTQDVAEIAHLLKLERFHRDTGQWEQCRAAFHPDNSKTHVDVAWSVFGLDCSRLQSANRVIRYLGGVDDFLARSAKTWQGKVNILHSSFDPVNIQVSGNRATSEAFCVITSSLTFEGVDYELASYMRLCSRLEKVAGDGHFPDRWCLLSLESVYVRDRLVTASPGLTGSLVMTDEIRDSYPKGYRHLALVMKQRGLKPRLNLPHEDDQEGVRELLQRNETFLHGKNN